MSVEVPIGAAEPAASIGWRWYFLALLAYLLIGVALTGPALLGSGSLLPEGFLDHDVLFGRPSERAVLRPAEDPAPVVIELGRERAVAAGLRAGRLDTWTPLVGGGAPLWAESGSPFFPTKVVSYLLPGHSGYMLALVVRLVLASLGMFALAAALGLPRCVALFCGALLECSGAFVANVGYVSSSAAFMLPWALYAAQRLAAEQTLHAMGVAALVLGITSYGNHPSYILFVVVGFIAWLATAVAQQGLSGRQWVKVVPLALGAGTLALLISAVTSMPFLELVSQGFTYKNSEVAERIWQERLSWTREVFAVALLFPSLMSAARDSMGFHLWPWAQGAAIGLLALALAGAGIHGLRRHWAIAVVLALGLGLTLAPWGLQWLHHLPGIRIVLPWYCYPLIAVPLCVLAGYGLTSIVGRPEAPRRLYLPLGVACGVLVLLLLFASRLGWSMKQHLTELLGVDFTALESYSAIVPSGLTLITPAAMAAAVLACVFLRRRPGSLGLVIALIAVAEALLVRAPVVAFERSHVLLRGPSQTVERLRDLLADGSWRFSGLPPLEISLPNSALLFGLRDLRSFHALAVGRHARFVELAGSQGDSPWRFPQWQYPPNLNIPLLSLAAVRYVVLAKDCLATNCRPEGLRPIQTAGRVVLFENPLALPRFRIAHDVVRVQGAQQAESALRQLIGQQDSAGGHTWRNTVVVEEPAADLMSPAASEGPDSRASEWVRRVAEPDPQTIVLQAQLERPGYLIVADTWYPGWIATVNGKPSPVLPANVQFRAVSLPAGRHDVVLTYHSTYLKLGAALSTLALGLSLAIVVWQGWRPREPAA